MADVADRSDEYTTMMNNVTINRIRNQGRELLPTGECRWCEEPFDEGSKKLFCDIQCSNDYELSKTNKRVI